MFWPECNFYFLTYLHKINNSSLQVLKSIHFIAAINNENLSLQELNKMRKRNVMEWYCTEIDIKSSKQAMRHNLIAQSEIVENKKSTHLSRALRISSNIAANDEHDKITIKRKTVLLAR